MIKKNGLVTTYPLQGGGDMRRVYFKVNDVANFRYRMDMSQGEPLVEIKNDRGHQILLRDAIVKRTLLGGIYFEDGWGSYDKWFSDHQVSRSKRW